VIVLLLGGCTGGGAGRSSTSVSPEPNSTEELAWSVGQLAFGPDGALYATDCELARVFRFDRSGAEAVFAGSGPGGFDNGFSGDGGPAIEAHFGCPIGVVFDTAGRLFVTDHLNNRVREIDADGTITTVAGNGDGALAGDSGKATEASMLAPSCLAFDGKGNLYICDRDNGVVRKVDRHGIITTVAGTGTRGYSGDGGPATKAQLDQPEGLAFDPQGNLYISDSANNRVRRVDTHGVITTFAGNGSAGNAGEDVPATKAGVVDPNGLAFDTDGNLFVSAVDAGAVRMIDRHGIITTVAGTGVPGLSGDGGPATKAQLASPFGLVFDETGNLYVADPENHRIRVIDTRGVIRTFAAAPQA
jgi:sugar lactone lactonase YvrE